MSIHSNLLDSNILTLNYVGGLAQLARAPALHAGGRRFDSDILHREIVCHTIKNDKTFKKNNEILKRRISLYKSRV